MADFIVDTTPTNYDVLFSTTPAVYAPRIEDNFFNSTLFFFWLNKMGRKKMLNGGHAINVGLMYDQNQTVEWIGDYDPISIDPQEGLTIAQYAWKQIAASIVVSDMEIAKNSSIDSALDLVQFKIEQAELSVRNAINTASLGSQDQDPLQPFGLQDFMEAEAPTNQSKSVGGISAATYTWWRNRYDHVGSNTRGVDGDDGNGFADTGLAAMRFTYNTCSEGSDHPDLILTTQTGFENYETEVTSIERINRVSDDDVGRRGFTTLRFKGATIGFDDSVDAGVNAVAQNGLMYFINSRYIQWVVHTMFNFRLSPLERVFTQQMARRGTLQTICALTLSNKRRQGVIEHVNDPT